MKPLSEIVRAREKGIPFESVKTELEEALPGFPDDVLYQWVYWHNSQFIDENAYIGLSRFHFEYKKVPCEWVYSVIDENIEVLDYWGEDFLKGNRNRSRVSELSSSIAHLRGSAERRKGVRNNGNEQHRIDVVLRIATLHLVFLAHNR